MVIITYLNELFYINDMDKKCLLHRDSLARGISQIYRNSKNNMCICNGHGSLNNQNMTYHYLENNIKYEI